MQYETDPNGCDTGLPLIYLWHVGDDTYVGRARKGRRRFARYALNVRRLAEDKPALNGRGYRAVHLRMAEAAECGEQIKVTVVENCAPEQLTERERYWISELKPTLNRTLR